MHHPMSLRTLLLCCATVICSMATATAGDAPPAAPQLPYRIFAPSPVAGLASDNWTFNYDESVPQEVGDDFVGPPAPINTRRRVVVELPRLFTDTIPPRLRPAPWIRTQILVGPDDVVVDVLVPPQHVDDLIDNPDDAWDLIPIRPVPGTRGGDTPRTPDGDQIKYVLIPKIRPS